MTRRVSKLANELFGPQHDSKAVIHCLSCDELYEHAPEIKRKLAAFTIDLSEFIKCDFKIGPIKERKVSDNKIIGEFSGNEARLNDVVRTKTIMGSGDRNDVDPIMQTYQARKMLDPWSIERHPLLKEHGIYVVQTSDYIEDPKDETLYGCLNVKLAIPIDGTNKYYPTEIQVTHDEFEKVYTQTHDPMRKAQEIAKNTKGREMTPEEAEKREAYLGYCKYLNNSAREKAGLTFCLNDDARILDDEEKKKIAKNTLETLGIDLTLDC